MFNCSFSCNVIKAARISCSSGLITSFVSFHLKANLLKFDVKRRVSAKNPSCGGLAAAPTDGDIPHSRHTEYKQRKVRASTGVPQPALHTSSCAGVWTFLHGL